MHTYIHTITLHYIALHYIYITFTLHLHYIYITFTLHLHCITLHLHYIYITLHLHDITLHLHYIYFTFTLHLHYIKLHLHYITWHYITLNYIYITFTLHLHCITLHLHYICIYIYITLHYITLHYIHIYIYIIRILLSWLHLVRAVGSGSRLFGLWRYAVGIGAEVDCGEHRDADPMALIMGLQGMPLEWKIFDFHISCDEKWGYHGICMGDTWFHGIDTLRQVAGSYGKSVFLGQSSIINGPMFHSHVKLPDGSRWYSARRHWIMVAHDPF